MATGGGNPRSVFQPCHWPVKSTKLQSFARFFFFSPFFFFVSHSRAHVVPSFRLSLGRNSGHAMCQLGNRGTLVQFSQPIWGSRHFVPQVMCQHFLTRLSSDLKKVEKVANLRYDKRDFSSVLFFFNLTSLGKIIALCKCQKKGLNLLTVRRLGLKLAAACWLINLCHKKNPITNMVKMGADRRPFPSDLLSLKHFWISLLTSIKTSTASKTGSTPPRRMWGSWLDTQGEEKWIRNRLITLKREAFSTNTPAWWAAAEKMGPFERLSRQLNWKKWQSTMAFHE